MAELCSYPSHVGVNLLNARIQSNADHLSARKGHTRDQQFQARCKSPVRVAQPLPVPLLRVEELSRDFLHHVLHRSQYNFRPAWVVSIFELVNRVSDIDSPEDLLVRDVSSIEPVMQCDDGMLQSHKVLILWRVRRSFQLRWDSAELTRSVVVGRLRFDAVGAVVVCSLL